MVNVLPATSTANFTNMRYAVDFVRTSHMNFLRITGLLVAGPKGRILSNVKLLDFEKNEATMIDNTKVSPFFMFTNLNDFDDRLYFDKPNSRRLATSEKLVAIVNVKILNSTCVAGWLHLLDIIFCRKANNGTF